MAISIAIYWLVLSALCFALEVFGVVGVGFFFAGLGALSVAILMQTGTPAEAAFIAQFAWFFGFTMLWTAALWKPIKRYQSRKRPSDFSNMVGDRAIVVGAPLEKNKDGQVKWSGTLMVAELSQDSAAQSIGIDEAVVIKSVKGNRLFVDTI